MDYQMAEQQFSQFQTQSQNTIQQLQQLAQKMRAAAPDESTGREWAMDLRELAMAIQQQNQTITMLLQQMGQYIRQLESQQAAVGQNTPNMAQPNRGWANPGGFGGGFLGSMATGLGLGAGFAVADNIVDDIFNLF